MNAKHDGTSRQGDRRVSRRAWAAAAVLGCASSAGALWYFNRGRTMPPAQYTYEVVREYPHDPTAFTQGLVFEDGFLYEGTGHYGQSTLRKVELETGRVVRAVALEEKFFGEGIAVVGDRIVQLTWQQEAVFVYDKRTFDRIATLTYKGEMWGLAHDGRHLILSDGTPTLRFLEPNTLRLVRKVTVTDDGRRVAELNELEHVDGEVLANVWHEDHVARIDPETGRVRAWVEFRGLLPWRGRDREDVLNGIAYDRQGRRLFVTGKNWPKLFEVRIVPAG